MRKWQAVDVIVGGLVILLGAVVVAKQFMQEVLDDDDASILGSVVGVISVYVGLRLQAVCGFFRRDDDTNPPPA